MHVAAAVGTPVIALFGPTNASKTGPYGARGTVLAADSRIAPRARAAYPIGLKVVIACARLLQPRLRKLWQRVNNSANGNRLCPREKGVFVR